MALNRKDNQTLVVDNVISNTSVNVIKITEDKLYNILTKHIAKLRSAKDWINPVAVSVSLLLALLTTDFKTAFGLSSDTWKAVFIILFGISVIYSLYSICHCIFSRSNINLIIKDIKNER